MTTDFDLLRTSDPVIADIKDIGVIHFDERDVVRHQLVQQIVKAYEAFTASTKSSR